MKILVTGHLGFIGQNMVPFMKNEGHSVFTHDWKESPYVPDVKGLDWVIHLGAISSTTDTDFRKVLDQNYDFSVDLFNRCAEHSVNLQWASSASVYGPYATHFAETYPPNPKSPYAWSKYLFERYVEKNRKYITVQGFRYFNVYGPHEDHKGDQASPQHKFALQAKEKGKILIFDGSDGFKRDFVPVQRVLEVHKSFLSIPKSGVWNVGTGKATSFQEVAESFSVPIGYIPMPSNISKHYQKYTCADLTKLNKDLACINT